VEVFAQHEKFLTRRCVELDDGVHCRRKNPDSLRLYRAKKCFNRRARSVCRLRPSARLERPLLPAVALELLSAANH
jgi:hypothetical protein